MFYFITLYHSALEEVAGTKFYLSIYLLQGEVREKVIVFI